MTTILFNKIMDLIETNFKEVGDLAMGDDPEKFDKITKILECFGNIFIGFIPSQKYKLMIINLFKDSKDKLMVIVQNIISEPDLEQRKKLVSEIGGTAVDEIFNIFITLSKDEDFLNFLIPDVEPNIDIQKVLGFFEKNVTNPFLFSSNENKKQDILAKQDILEKQDIAKEDLLQEDEIDLFDVYPRKKVELYDGMGHVELMDMMPRKVPVDREADIAIVRNARVSYLTKCDKSKEQDAKLINYLVRNRHTSPLESVVFQFKIRLPIFVERQLIRHRTARVNEQSMRYTQADDAFYYPALRMQSKNNKQGSSDEPVSEVAQQLWEEVATLTEEMYKKYGALVKSGVAREVARCCLPVSLMTEMMWQMDLHNLRHFLQLRMAPDAQKEIRDLAHAIYHIVKKYVPASIADLSASILN